MLGLTWFCLRLDLSKAVLGFEVSFMDSVIEKIKAMIVYFLPIIVHLSQLLCQKTQLKTVIIDLLGQQIQET